MDFKSLLSQLDQLNEATDRSEPGKVKHSADPGGYGRKDDEDEEVLRMYEAKRMQELKSMLGTY